MKKQIITIIAGVAVLGVLLLVGGCEPKNESLPPVEAQIEETELSTEPVTETPNTEASEETEPPVTVPEPTEGLVSDAYCDTSEYETTEYNRVTQKLEKVTLILEYHIPKINLPGEAVNQINQEMYKKLKKSLDETLNCQEQYGYPVSYKISYEWSANGDILSLIVLDGLTPEYGGDEYIVYNVSISSGEIVSKDAVLSAGGMTEAQYNECAKARIEEDYRSICGIDNITDEGFQKFAKGQLQKTLKQDNISFAKPYLNNKGQLCILYRYYAIAGGEYYWTTLNLTDGSVGTDFYSDDTAESTQTMPEQSAMESYKAILSECSDKTAEYTLYDLDKDGTPELIVKEKSTQYYVYSYIDGKAVLCGKETWRYANCLYEYDGNGILVHDGGMGSLHMEYLISFTLQDGKLKHGEFVRSLDNEDIDKALKEYKNVSSFCTVDDVSLLEG